MNTAKIAELNNKIDQLKTGGGSDRIAKQHSLGKFTARERIALLLDPGTFVETGLFVKHRCPHFGMDKVDVPAEGVVTGYGKINNRLVFLAAQDFTVLGGTLGEMHAAKICEVMDLAVKVGAPFIFLNDSGGARIQEGVDSMKGYGDVFYRNIRASGVIPQIAAIMGPCAGGATYSPALTDFIFQVKGAHMFIAGPEVVKAVTGEEMTMEQLGGVRVHGEFSGVAHFTPENETECLALIKKLLSYLPQSNREFPPYQQPDSFAEPVREIQIKDVIPASPREVYDVRQLIACLVDKASFLEIQAQYACNVVIGFARLHGRPVGIVASQPMVLAGCLDINASDKAARFVRFCDAFNIPLLTLMDVPGYLPGAEQEYGGIIRHGAKLLYAFGEATVPKITVILRKGYGGAYVAMCSRHLGADVVFALPAAEIAVMGPEGAVNVIFRKEIANSKNPELTRDQLIKDYQEKFANPYVAAARGYINEVVAPDNLRTRLIQALLMLENKKETGIWKKHGNIPL